MIIIIIDKYTEYHQKANNMIIIIIIKHIIKYIT